MTRGFITLAVGQDSYYELAYNLLMSYRKSNGLDYPWTLVCDRKNKWTTDFDNVILLETPCFSYMDKLTLFGITPYDECIFIDADCLIFEKLDVFWERMSFVDGFSCFGNSLPLDSEDGWFCLNDVGEWKNQISFIPQMHGGICFIKKGEKLNQILNRAKDIESNYHKFRFKYFDKPADEPILALAMAIEKSRPLKAEPNDFVFLPTVKKINLNKMIIHSCAECTTQKDAICNIRIIHFQNHNTIKTKYKIPRDVLLKSRRYSEYFWYCIYSLIDAVRPWIKRFKRMWGKLTNV